MSRDKERTPDHPILVECERRALAWLRSVDIADLPDELRSKAFTSPARRAFFDALLARSEDDAAPRAPDEIANLPPPDTSSDLRRVRDAAGARALRDAADALSRAATGWLSEPTDAKVCELHTAVNTAVERIAFAWPETSHSAADLQRWAEVWERGGERRRDRRSVPAPFPWLQAATGGIPLGSLVVVRDRRSLDLPSVAVEWALATARANLPAALWARRLTLARVADDLVAIGAQISLRRLRECALDGAEWSAVHEAEEGMAALPLLVAGGMHTITAGDLLRHLRRWWPGVTRSRVVVVDGAEHLDIEPRVLWRAARMTGQLYRGGYLVVIAERGHAFEDVADIVIDAVEQAIVTDRGGTAG